jgi:predicted nucleic acid-binding protein
MILLDSCAWLGYFSGGPHAESYLRVLRGGPVAVPAICLAEVFKSIRRQRGTEEALKAAAFMKSFDVVPLDGELALESARVSQEMRLPLADSIVYATAAKVGATLYTEDADFKGLPRVRFFGRSRSK